MPTLDERARPICREVGFDIAGKSAFPIIKLGRDLRSVEILALPDRKIGELNGQWRKWRRFALDKRAVDRSELVG